MKRGIYSRILGAILAGLIISTSMWGGCADSNHSVVYHTTESEHAIAVLEVPYVHQVYDSPDNFVGSLACAPASAVMVLAYYSRIPPEPIQVSYPSKHTSNYGKYLSMEYTYDDYTFSIEHTEPYVCRTESAIGKGAWGYIWKGGIYHVKDNLISYLGLHDIETFFIEQPTETQAKNLVQEEIDAGRPLIARTLLTNLGHYVVIVGYEVDTQGHFWYKANDPLGKKINPLGDEPYGDNCRGNYETQQPVNYSYSQMQLGFTSRGLITTQLNRNNKPSQ